MERRHADIELRAAGRRLEGLAAVYGVEARIGDFTETIRPGAFADALRGGADILALVDHDPGKVLGRTRSGSLRLREAEHGLFFDLDVPDTTAGNDILALVRSGNAGGCSFGFIVPEGGERWEGRRRELLRLDLREISVVSAWPAYEGTTIAARARQGRRRAPARHLARLWLETLR